MKYYGKIDTMFRRFEDFRINMEQFRNPVIPTIGEWVWTEKVDGTNTFIRLNPDNTVEYGGKSAKTQMYPELLKHLQDNYPVERLLPARHPDEDSPLSMTFFGEGYGKGIQKVGFLYSSTQKFILFDILIGDKWWLSDDQVTEIAAMLQMPRAPIIGQFSIWAAIEEVEHGFGSLVSESLLPAEGLVGRTLIPLYMNNGRRLICKIKTIDFEGVGK